MCRLDPIERSAAKFNWSLGLGAGLRVSGVPHVGGDDGLQRLSRQPGGEIGEKPLERGSAEWKKAAIVARQDDLHAIQKKLEVDRSAGALDLVAELSTLHVDADKEPANDADDRAYDARDDSI
ncbi:MAG: hypothetical protein M3T56_04930 [Chloroflexota bacterium]|nr:hypothetical protein [Chloroflexota bacterium]